MPLYVWQASRLRYAQLIRRPFLSRLSLCQLKSLIINAYIRNGCLCPGAHPQGGNRRGQPGARAKSDLFCHQGKRTERSRARLYIRQILCVAITENQLSNSPAVTINAATVNAVCTATWTSTPHCATDTQIQTMANSSDSANGTRAIPAALFRSHARMKSRPSEPTLMSLSILTV
jgi:hypothetical protein